MYIWSLSPLDQSFMMISLKLAVSVEAVSDNRAARLNGLGNKLVKSCTARIWNTTQADTPDPSAIALGGHCDKAFALGESPNRSAAFCRAPVGFIDLDTPTQSFSSGPHHGQSHLVQHAPCCFVTAQAQIPLQGQSAHATFLSRHEPHCSKPGFDGKFRILKDRACDDGGFVTASQTFDESLLAPPTLGSLALRAPISTRPSKRFKIGTAIGLVFKLLFEFRLVSRIGLCHADNTISCGTGVT